MSIRGHALAGTRPTGVFQRPLPIALMYATFFLVCLPLVILRAVPNEVAIVPYLIIAEAVGLGTSHFFVTLAVYFEPGNMRHFASGPRRRMIYFGLPIAILLVVALQGALNTQQTFPRFSFFFYAGVRFLDFFHVGRQSAGVLQLWKRPLGEELPRWTRAAENAFFVGAGLLQWQTFLRGGEFVATDFYDWLPVVLLAALFAASVVPYLALLSRPQTHKLALLALGYFVMQALCAATAVYATWLYVSVLAMHYVEYHVLMARRGLDRAGERSNLLRRPFLLYGVLAVLVVSFEARNYVVTESIPLGLLVHVFDGIFLVHYVLDAWLWKFSDPYYRQTLAALYFGPAQAVSARPASFGKRLRAPALALSALVAVACYPGLRQRLHAELIVPLEAEQHFRWGVALARSGELMRAQHELTRAAELMPEDRRVRGLLAAIARHASASAVDTSGARQTR